MRVITPPEKPRWTWRWPDISDVPLEKLKAVAVELCGPTVFSTLTYGRRLQLIARAFQKLGIEFDEDTDPGTYAVLSKVECRRGSKESCVHMYGCAIFGHALAMLLKLQEAKA